MKFMNIPLGILGFVMISTPSFAGTPAPIVGGSIPGLVLVGVLVGVVGAGYLFLRAYRSQRTK